MRKFKKLTGVLLASALVLTSLAACGSNNDASGSGNGEVFKIGGIGPTTGGASIFGQAVQNGAQLAVDEINAAGGINGFQIEFNFQDDEHDAEKSVNAYNTLKDWGMQILLGTVTSTPAVAVVEEAFNDNLFMLTPSATAVAAIGHPNAFRVCFSDPDQGVASAEFIADNNLATRIAVIYDSSDVYSSGIFEAFQKEAEVRGLDLVSVEAFTSASNTDFSVQLQKAQEADAELLFLPFYYQEASLVLKQAHDMGFAPIIFSCDGMDGILDVDGFDTSLADGVMFLAPFASTSEDEAVVSFVNAFQDRFGNVPNQFAANAYDGIYIIKAAIEHAGITPDMDVSEIGDKMIAAMQEITFNGVTMYNSTWTADGEPKKDPMVIEIRDGVYHVVQYN